MQVTSYPSNMGAHNAYGLFRIEPVEGGLFVVLVHDFPVIHPVPYKDAHELFASFVQKTTRLDGNARSLAMAWAHAAHAQDNLTATQARCSELIQDARATARALKQTRDTMRTKLYEIKFALEQGTSPHSIIESLIDSLDEARSEGGT